MHKLENSAVFGPTNCQKARKSVKKGAKVQFATKIVSFVFIKKGPVIRPKTCIYVCIFLFFSAHLTLYRRIVNKILKISTLFSISTFGVQKLDLCLWRHFGFPTTNRYRVLGPRQAPKPFHWLGAVPFRYIYYLSLIHIWRCRRLLTCRSRWSPYH